MSHQPRARSLAAAVVAVAGLGSSVVLVGFLARQVAVERDRAARSTTDERGVRNQLGTVKEQLKESREESSRLAENRTRESGIAEAEIMALRRDLADARREREEWRGKYRVAAAERDRAAEELLAARRDAELLRDDVARSGERAAAAAENAKGKAAAADDAARRLQEGRERVAALLRPLFQDLRSPDGTIRVRAHEALCQFAGRELPYRPGAPAEEREADAMAIEEVLSGK
jgi:chromosome segregation ATPase